MRFCKAVTYPVYRPTESHTFAELDFDSHAVRARAKEGERGRERGRGREEGWRKRARERWRGREREGGRGGEGEKEGGRARGPQPPPQG